MSKSSSDLLLHGRNEPVRIGAECVYFTFGSGRLDYDCAACGAKCCRGFGYNLRVGAELQKQLSASHAAVRFFLHADDALGENGYLVGNCPPGCFFLDEDSLCGIQREHGEAAKPETCRLFPFNWIRRAGPYLIVSPHSSLCPLRVLPAGETSERSRHESLQHAMAAQGIGVAIPRVDGPTVTLETLIAVERCIVDRSERHLDDRSYESFAEAQHSEMSAVLVRAGAEQERRTENANGRFMRTVCAVVGIDDSIWQTPDPEVVRCVVACTPLMRAELIFAPSDEHADRLRLPLDQIPDALRVLCLIVALARVAGMREITYQTVMRVFRDNRALLLLLSGVERVVTLRASEVIELRATGNQDVQARYVGVLRALLPAEQTKARRTLGEILCAHVGSDSVGRLMVLRSLARHLNGRIVPLDEARRDKRWSQRLRPAMQRWAIRRLPDATLIELAARRGHVEPRRT